MTLDQSSSPTTPSDLAADDEAPSVAPSHAWGRHWWRSSGWAWAWYLVCVLARFPNLVYGATPYAEEGVVYYAYATRHGVVDTLGFRFGYFSLIANVTAVLEAALPVAFLRWVSPLAGLIGPTLVVALVIRQRRPRWRVALAIAVVVFTITMEREWSSVIHAQFWLGAAMVVMIGTYGTTKQQRRGDLVIACVAGLSGLIAVMAAPGLIVEALRKRRQPQPDDQQTSRHLLIVTALLVSTSVINRLVTTPRTRTMPIIDLIPTVFLKVVWQPITGVAGNSVGQRLMAASPLSANVLAIVGFAAVGAVLALVLRGKWLVCALTAIFVSAAAIAFSLPPASDLATTLGGRYALPGVIPLGIALAIGARRHTVTTSTTNAPSVASGARHYDIMVHARSLQPVAWAVSIAWVLAAVHSGWLTSTWITTSNLNTTTAFVSSVQALGPDQTGTVQIDGVCRVAPNPTATTAGTSIATAWQSDGSLRVEVHAPLVDNGQPSQIYVWASTGSQNFRVDVSGNQPLDGYTYGVFTEDLPGTCYPFTNDVAPSATLVDQGVVIIPAESFAGIDKSAIVRVGVGESVNDAMAMRTFKFAGLVGDSQAATD